MTTTMTSVRGAGRGRAVAAHQHRRPGCGGGPARGAGHHRAAGGVAPRAAGAAMAAVDAVLAALDLQASRFRPDSEISWLHRSAGGLFMLSDGLAEAVRVALEAARWTGGLTDPTVGEALISLGYDRDFAAIDPNRREPPPAPQPAPGWQQVRLDGPLLWLPAASGSIWAPRRRALDPTARPGLSWPPPGTPAEY